MKVESCPLRAPRAASKQERQRRRLRGGIPGDNPGSASGGLAPHYEVGFEARKASSNAFPIRGGPHRKVEVHPAPNREAARIEKARFGTAPAVRLGVSGSRRDLGFAGWLVGGRCQPRSVLRNRALRRTTAVASVRPEQLSDERLPPAIPVKSALESHRNVSKRTNRLQLPQPDSRRMRAREAEGIPACGSRRAKPAKKEPASGVPRGVTSARAPVSSRKQRAEESAPLRSTARQGVPEVRVVSVRLPQRKRAGGPPANVSSRQSAERTRRAEGHAPK